MKPAAPFALALALAASFLPSLSQAADPSFRHVTLDSKIAIGYGIAVADINGDQKPDIVLCDKNQIAWYRNPSWEKFVIAENLTPLDHVCVAADDIDGDGRAEIAVGAGWNPGDTLNSGAVFYLIPPADRTQKWEPVALPHEPTVHRMRWVKDWQQKSSLIVVPLHGRGNKDAQGDGVKIQRYTPPANPKDPWKIDTLDASLHKTHNFDPVQWDDDPAHELIVGGREGAFLINWSPADRAYKRLQLGSDANGGVGEIRLGKGPANSRFIAAVSPMHGNQLVVFTPPPQSADPNSNLWTRSVLDESLVDGHAVACADFIGAGSDQIAVGWRAMGKPAAVKVGIKLFLPDPNSPSRWRSILVDDNTMACEDLLAADLNGDQKPDLIAAGRATKNLKIYFNESR